MGTPYLSEIRIVSFNFAPKGWALCNGQVMPINQNQALFSLLGTTYGGDGQTTFALPNLQGRVPISWGTGFGASYVLGQTGGLASVVLAVNQLPPHNHQAQSTSAVAALLSPVGSIWADSTANPYATSAGTQMNLASVQQQGGNQGHSNLQPYEVLNFVIALSGIFPSRN